MVTLTVQEKKVHQRQHTDYSWNKWKDIVIIAASTNNSILLRTFTNTESFKYFLSLYIFFLGVSVSQLNISTICCIESCWKLQFLYRLIFSLFIAIHSECVCVARIFLYVFVKWKDVVWKMWKLCRLYFLTIGTMKRETSSL